MLVIIIIIIVIKNQLSWLVWNSPSVHPYSQSTPAVVYFSAQELKDHPYFDGIDWQQVYLQKYPPPLIPPRGEVNAADAFDIGSFDEEDTKGIKVRSVFCGHCFRFHEVLGVLSIPTTWRRAFVLMSLALNAPYVF